MVKGMVKKVEGNMLTIVTPYATITTSNNSKMRLKPEDMVGILSNKAGIIYIVDPAEFKNNVEFMPEKYEKELLKTGENYELETAIY